MKERVDRYNRDKPDDEKIQTIEERIQEMVDSPVSKDPKNKGGYTEYEIKAQDEQHANDLLGQYIKAGTDKSTGDVYVVPTGYSFTGDETIQPEDMELEEA